MKDLLDNLLEKETNYMKKHMKVLVIGGGFAGIEAAIQLSKKKFNVTLISNRDFFYIYPLAIWIPTGEKTVKDISIPISKLAKRWGFTFQQGTVESVSGKNKTVVVDGQQVQYDYLVVAIGAPKVQIPGMAENSGTICGEPDEATILRERIEKILERGEGTIAVGFGGNPKDPSAVRGGPAFEVLFNLEHLLEKKKLKDKVKLVFFAPMAEPGKRMGAKSMKGTLKYFEKLGITEQLGKKIKKFEKDGIIFEDDSKIQSDLTIFVPAGRGNDILMKSDLAKSEAGFVKINGFAQVDNFDHVYAAGDSVDFLGPDWKAKQGHLAEVMSKVIAHNIEVQATGRGRMHSYEMHVNILCIMDTGRQASFIFRNDNRAHFLPLPFIGHQLKQLWGKYFRASKMGRFPRLPGM